MVAVQSSKCYIFEVCVCAKRMRRTMLSSVVCPAVQCFSVNYLINGTIFGKMFLNVRRFDFLYKFCLKYVSFFEEFSEIFS